MDPATLSTIFSGITAIIAALGAIFVPIAIARINRNTNKVAEVAKVSADKVEVVAGALTELGTTVTKLEVNTNSIREALTSATAKASHLEGKEEGRAEEKAKAALRVEGAAGAQPHSGIAEVVEAGREKGAAAGASIAATGAAAGVAAQKGRDKP